MSWPEQYRQKLTTADRAVETIRSGDRVYVHAGCATPVILIDALLKRAPSLENIELNHMLTLGNADYTLPQYEGHFRHNGCSLATTSGTRLAKAARTTRPSSSARSRTSIRPGSSRWT